MRNHHPPNHPVACVIARQKAMNSIIDELTWRGLLYDCTGEARALLSREPVILYNGFDPTADSLHIGHLVPLMNLARFQRFGHRPIALAGGGTGMIGDPSGRSSERQLLSAAQVEANVEAIKQQMARFLDFEAPSNPALLLNNADWLAPMSMMNFLRDVGKHITVNYMLAKDSVRSRLEGEGGISYTEFSYMLLQAYDFMHLREYHNCVLQTGGSDQWGNIVAGVELTRKVSGKDAHGLVYPLVTKADGSKFGKTASGTIWLDAQRTSPYRFYQFWLNTDDADAITYLKYFTWLGEAEINDLAAGLAEHPERREAQRRLARELTTLLHGTTALARAEQAAQVLFGGELAGLGAADIADIFADVPSSRVPRGELAGEGKPLVDLLISSGLASSRGDARRAIQGGGIYLNNQQVNDQARPVLAGESIDGRYIVLRKGRKNYHLIQLID